mmetsp:Transcript_64349/g.129382  ORF Transcript_64349/g.129382 Transcript_64349/m.129382 type:complete len:797 (-) Transcript_64349:28-2418(-)
MSLDITPEDVYMHQLQGNSDEERESNLRTRRRLAALLAPSVKGDAKNTAAADPEPSKASSKPVARKAGGTGKRGRKRANAAFAQAALGDPDQIYEIERIVDVRWAGNPNEAATDRDYLVSWKGYPNSNNSWEPETSFVSSLPLQPWQDKWQELPKTSNSAASSVGGGASALSSSSHPANDKNSNAGKRARTVRSKLGGGGGGGGSFGSSMVAAIYAEALMQLRPWKLWTLQTNENATDATCDDALAVEVAAVLESALAVDPNHPALCHLYIHLMEMSTTPSKALPQCDVLRGRFKSFGHLLHMPSHIDVQVGQYDLAVKGNEAGVAADLVYFRQHSHHNFYHGYLVHNYHFLAWAAMFDAQFYKALHASRALVETTPASMVTEFGDFLEGYLATHWHVLIRFGKWAEILAEPLIPTIACEPHKCGDEDEAGDEAAAFSKAKKRKVTALGEEHFPVCVAFAHYAKGLAHASLGNVRQALTSREAFEAAKRVVVESYPLRRVHNVLCSQSLEVASAMLRGEVLFRQGGAANMAESLRTLRTAVELDDALPYDEPWGWMVPSRHALGALLTDAASALMNSHSSALASSPPTSAAAFLPPPPTEHRAAAPAACAAAPVGTLSVPKAASMPTAAPLTTPLTTAEDSEGSSLEDDYLRQAVAVFRDDLEGRPCNVWALAGLEACLKLQLQQQKQKQQQQQRLQEVSKFTESHQQEEEEDFPGSSAAVAAALLLLEEGISQVQASKAVAGARADFPVAASCFCAAAAGAAPPLVGKGGEKEQQGSGGGGGDGGELKSRSCCDL